MNLQPECFDGGVSVVVATYNQPEKLLASLRSVALQTVKPAEVIVVGDCCGPDTERAISTIELGGLRYVNLPMRCGEQSIPNAIGTLLASSRYVAYLNHDDLWFPNHLETALDTMAESGRQWFIGSAAFCDRMEVEGDSVRPMFLSRTSISRSVRASFGRAPLYLEPASSWVISRSYVLGVGNWSPAWTIARTPVSNLPLRIWRRYGEPAFSQALSVAKINGNRLSDGPHYSQPAHGYREFVHAMRGAGEFWPHRFSWPEKESAARDKPEARFAPGVTGRFSRPLLLALLGMVFLVTALDFVERYLQKGGLQGEHLSRSLSRRTGESALGRYTVAQVVAILNRLEGLVDQEGG